MGSELRPNNVDDTNSKSFLPIFLSQSQSITEKFITCLKFEDRRNEFVCKIKKPLKMSM